ncbi:pentatricopeptide repeat-containing protein At2g20710, mitochondrial-like [Bidens hawaiensis]|uniref:pentatricopeptide repeat-containing protein At2g20710, mitochondrial-like n=1 Tax=Bidens hawaiensis TaxID=980011 RepID=UPI00404B27A6
MMMALVRSFKPSSISRLSVSRVLLYSTETSVKPSNDNLYRRISPVGDPNVSLIPILNQWEKEGKAVIFSQLIVIIKSLRKFNRYTHALQLSEWMAKKKGKLSPAGVAVHLDLVSRVQGVVQAENYFNTVPENVKSLQVYGALLNCYATTKSTEKAEALAEKMKQMGMMTTLSYNSMINLYKKTGDYEKLDKTYQEMTETGVSCDKPTFYLRLSACATSSDLEQMEKILKHMEDNSSLGVDWNAYTIASGGYIKSGLNDKAFEVLQKSEKYIKGNSKGAAWEILIGKYASIGKKDDVYRIWNLYKTSWSKVYNRGYSAIVNALVRLDDIDGAEKLLTEWENAKLSFDFRIPNMLIRAYCTKGDLVKAEAYVDRLVGMGKQPPASTWVLLASAYAKGEEMEKAVEMLKKCVAAEDMRGCRLDPDVFTACVEYLKGNGDLKMMEEVEKVFKDRVRVPRVLDVESFDDEAEESESLMK